MNLNDIFIHDSVLEYVTEEPEIDKIIFDIDWPKDWENHIYAKAQLIFDNALEYEVHEGPIFGKPTILEMYEEGEPTQTPIVRQRIKIETTAGYRTLLCSNVTLKVK